MAHGLTGSCPRTKDARSFLEKYKRVDIAVDAFYNNPNEFTPPGAQPKNKRNDGDKKLVALFDTYKGASGIVSLIAFCDLAHLYANVV